MGAPKADGPVAALVVLLLLMVRGEGPLACSMNSNVSYRTH